MPSRKERGRKAHAHGDNVQSLLAEPPRYRSPSGDFRCWLPRQPGLVTQLCTDTLTMEWVDALSGHAWQLLQQTVPTSERYVFFHDLRMMRTLPAASRTAGLTFAKTIYRQIANVVLVLPPDASSLLRMAVAVATPVLQLASIPCTIEATDDVDTLLVKYGLTAR